MSAWKTATAPDGRTYYWKDGGAPQWNKPADFDAPQTPATPATPQNDSYAAAGLWREAYDKDGKRYYWNTLSKETKWQLPEGIVAIPAEETPRQAPAFVAGGKSFGGIEYGAQDRRGDRRGDRDHGLPARPGSAGGRGGGAPWEQRQESMNYRGPSALKSDEPEYASHEQAEEAFFKLLRKHNISPDSTWEDALREVIREKEYRALKDPKQRKLAFEKYCQDVRAQEKGKEKERRAKLREDFLKMLSTHDEIKHYTRWSSARPMIEREAVFRSAGNDDERRQIFDEYILDLKKKNAEKETDDRRKGMQQLEPLLQALITDPDTKWHEAHEAIDNNERFIFEDVFKALSSLDVLRAFEDHMKTLYHFTNDAKQGEKRLHVRRERKARDHFKQLLQQMRRQGKIKASTKWSNFQPLIAQDERYLDLLGVNGSSPLDLFWDVVEEEDRSIRGLRNDAYDVLEDIRYEMTLDTTLDDFVHVMRSDPRTANSSEDQLSTIYEKMMDKIKKRVEDSRVINERSQRKAIDALRSAIKHLDPPVRLGDSYEVVAARLEQEAVEDYRPLDREGRKVAYEKHMRRLKEKEEDLERDRARRDRDRDRSRRDSDRDRDRRHRTRTPEIDAYEADRKKAQEARERQYRKPSFGLTPPPRERRDDRDDRYRRQDRRESMSIYDRERREREMERERSYISRADPRDRGRTLDYGDEDVVGSRPGSIRKRRDSEGSTSARREAKRPRRRTPEAESSILKEPNNDSPELQSGSEEGEIEEV